MPQPRRGLGKGLGALIPEGRVFTGGRTIVNIDINKIVPNPRQPRTTFADAELTELSNSIKSHGIAQPILARMRGGNYELVAGERRWRAAKKAGLTVIPAIVKEISDEDSLEIALIENLMREDLSPLDEAIAYQRLIKEFNLSQSEIAIKVGKNRTTISNVMRLLELPQQIQNSLREERISAGHARALLSIADPQKQISVWEQTIDKNLSVRDIETLVAPAVPRPKKKKKPATKNPELKRVEDELSDHLATKVKVYGTRDKGKIDIHYYSQDDLERILETIIIKKRK